MVGEKGEPGTPGVGFAAEKVIYGRQGIFIFIFISLVSLFILYNVLRI